MKNKKANKYETLLFWKKGDKDFPNSIQELKRVILLFEREEKLKKIYNK